MPSIEHRLLVRRLVSPSGHVTAVNVTIEFPGKDLTKENPEAVLVIREIAQEIRDTISQY